MFTGNANLLTALLSFAVFASAAKRALQSVIFEGAKPLPGFAGRSSESYTINFSNGSWFWFLDIAENGKLAMRPGGRS